MGYTLVSMGASGTSAFSDCAISVATHRRSVNKNLVFIGGFTIGNP